MFQPSIFSERLKELMFDHGEIKPQELADRIGVCAATISIWLRDVNMISLKNAVYLADFFHCSLDYLAGKTDRLETVTPRELPAFYEQLRKIMKKEGFTRYRIAKETSVKDSYLQIGKKVRLLALPPSMILPNIWTSLSII